jgi:peptidoglycan/LPS O-acetylase OafA/YrhL
LAVLAVVLARFEFRSKVLWGHWLAWVGDISYSLYLTHFFALSIFVQLLNRWGGDLKTWPLGCAVLFLVLTMSGAALSYRLIEQPSRRYFGRQWKSWRDKKWAVAEDVNV